MPRIKSGLLKAILSPSAAKDGKNAEHTNAITVNTAAIDLFAMKHPSRHLYINDNTNTEATSIFFGK